MGHRGKGPTPQKEAVLTFNPLRRKRSDTLAHYSACLNSDGVIVRAKCYRVRAEASERLEVILDAAGQRATLDVAVHEEGRLERIVSKAARSFAASVACRLGAEGRLV